MHVGVPGRVSGVDAASCKSVGYTGGTGDMFTNCHLLVLHADICDITSSSYVGPVTKENFKCTVGIWELFWPTRRPFVVSQEPLSGILSHRVCLSSVLQ